MCKALINPSYVRDYVQYLLNANVDLCLPDERGDKKYRNKYLNRRQKYFN